MCEHKYDRLARADEEGQEGEGKARQGDGKKRRKGRQTQQKGETLTGCDDVHGQREREEGRDPRLEVAREYSPLRMRELVAHPVARDCNPGSIRI